VLDFVLTISISFISLTKYFKQEIYNNFIDAGYDFGLISSTEVILYLLPLNFETSFINTTPIPNTDDVDVE
jgi:hypothetical protein